MVAPNFNSVVSEEIALPYDEKNVFLKYSYTDELLRDYSLIVIKDTTLGNEYGERVSTYIVRYPRYVHAEALRHRVISRNAASSRARSVKSTIQDVMENPVSPIWTVNQKGMGGKYADLEAREALTAEFLLARDDAVARVLAMLINPSIRQGKTSSEVANSYAELLADYYENGYDSNGEVKEGYLSAHKQNFNRLLEPFTQFEEVITSTYWDNFLSLRDHEDAQPEIRAIAVLVRAALAGSKPEVSDIHLPFIAEEDVPALEADWETEVKPVFLRSSAEAAQISYGDKSKAARATASSSLGERLFISRHFSPFEHAAIARGPYEKLAAREDSVTSDLSQLVSNFSDFWIQLRPILAGITK